MPLRCLRVPLKLPSVGSQHFLIAISSPWFLVLFSSLQGWYYYLPFWRKKQSPENNPPNAEIQVSWL